MSNRSGGFIPAQQQPEIQLIKLHKSNNGMGLSIVAAKVGLYGILRLEADRLRKLLQSNIYLNFYLDATDKVVIVFLECSDLFLGYQRL